MCERKSGHHIMFNITFRLPATLILQPGKQRIFLFARKHVLGYKTHDMAIH